LNFLAHSNTDQNLICVEAVLVSVHQYSNPPVRNERRRTKKTLGTLAVSGRARKCPSAFKSKAVVRFYCVGGRGGASGNSAVPKCKWAELLLALVVERESRGP